MYNKSIVKIFWFQALWKPRFENKRNFWNKLCLHQSIRVMVYPQWGICIHCIPTRGHSRHGILPSGHSHHGILSRRHLHSLHTQASISIHCILTRVHLHHSMHHKDIRITAYPQGYISIMAHSQTDIHIMAYPQGGIYIMTYLHEHLHHDIPT